MGGGGGRGKWIGRVVWWNSGAGGRGLYCICVSGGEGAFSKAVGGFSQGKPLDLMRGWS